MASVHGEQQSCPVSQICKRLCMSKKYLLLCYPTENFRRTTQAFLTYPNISQLISKYSGILEPQNFGVFALGIRIY